MKTLKKCVLALLLTLCAGYAAAGDWYVWEDPVTGGWYWCTSTGQCVLIDSVEPIDP